jgi:hypothetical protein
MEILKNLEWEALIVNEGWWLHPQKDISPLQLVEFYILAPAFE